MMRSLERSFSIIKRRRISNIILVSLLQPGIFGDYFLPLLGIDWKINEHIRTDFGDLPNNMNFEYKISNSIYSGIALLTNISSYRLNASTGGMYVREGDKTMGHDE